MTREQAKELKLFQIVRWNGKPEDFQDEDYKWLIPHCGKLAIVTERIIWEDEVGGEEIHLRFPEKRYMGDDFYETMKELMTDYNNGHDVTLSQGFDTGAECIDLVEEL